MTNETIQLLDHDCHPIHQSLTKVFSIYKGSCPVEFLQKRSAEILKLNPYLASTLELKDGFKLTYPKHMPESFKIYSHMVDHSIKHDLPYLELVEALNKYYIIRTGFSNQDKGPMFQFSTVEIANGYFILLFGQSHVLGDIHSLYRLARMISIKELVYPMNPVRHVSFNGLKQSLSRNILLLEERLCFKNWKEDLLNITRSDVGDNIPVISKLSTVKVYTVNGKRLNELKNDSKLKDGEKYITTNDIILWYWILM
jgi:hypothetical protein